MKQAEGKVGLLNRGGSAQSSEQKGRTERTLTQRVYREGGAEEKEWLRSRRKGGESDFKDSGAKGTGSGALGIKWREEKEDSPLLSKSRRRKKTTLEKRRMGKVGISGGRKAKIKEKADSWKSVSKMRYVKHI